MVDHAGDWDMVRNEETRGDMPQARDRSLLFSAAAARLLGEPGDCPSGKCFQKITQALSGLPSLTLEEAAGSPSIRAVERKSGQAEPKDSSKEPPQSAPEAGESPNTPDKTRNLSDKKDIPEETSDRAEKKEDSGKNQEKQALAAARLLEQACQIKARTSADKQKGDEDADILVRKDGTIEVNGTKGRSGSGPVIVEFEADYSGVELALQQKAVIRDMIAFLRMRNPQARIPEDWSAALGAALPPPVLRPRVTGASQESIDVPVGSYGGSSHHGAVSAKDGYFQAPGLRSFDGGGFHGSGGESLRQSIIPSGLDDSYTPMDIQSDKTDKPVDSLKLDSFIDRVVQAVAGNEGNFTSINPNDAGYGISIGIRQWNQKAGELPTLLSKWHDKDPGKFERIFGPYAEKLLNEGWVRHSELAGNPDLMARLKQALSDKDFQQVQVDLSRQFVRSSIELGLKYGLKSELALALVADIVNQKGRGGAEQALQRAGLHPGGTVSNEKATCERLSEVSHRPHADTRFSALKHRFSPGTSADTAYA